MLEPVVTQASFSRFFLIQAIMQAIVLLSHDLRSFIVCLELLPFLCLDLTAAEPLRDIAKLPCTPHSKCPYPGGAAYF